ncbi:hypothetical protein JXA32_10700 [Candidatus Sumerlaeota bacterium]|nr:hypothetical protein [Candidatus Sumerlaeota bacterium]
MPQHPQGDQVARPLKPAPLRTLLIGAPRQGMERYSFYGGRMLACALESAVNLNEAVRLFREESCCAVLFWLGEQDDGQCAGKLDELRRRMPGAPLIAVLPSPDETRAFDALCAGADDCMTADEVSEQRLRGAIRVALAHRIQLAEAAYGRRKEIDKEDVDTAHDLDESDAAQQQLKAELQQLEMMKNAFITVTSHELRTPLSSIIGMLNIINRDMQNKEPTLISALDTAINGADRLQKIVHRAITAAQTGTYHRIIKREMAPPADCLREVERKLAPFLELRHLNLMVDAEADMPLVFMDQRMICEALEQLLMNAIKFTPDGGYIVAAVRISPDHKSVIYRISDTGVGIAEEDRPFIFDDFFSSLDITHHSSGEYEFAKRGLGLGLSFVKRCVEAHGGTVGMETTQGAGSMFFFTLPVRMQ